MPSQTREPSAQISNGQIRAEVYLPNAQTGFYRSTRFDWSGAFKSLEYQGHQYYGPWFTKVEPPTRDFVYRDDDIVVGAQSAMTGPVEEFRIPQGFVAAKAGGTFVKIGVGVLRKPDDARYSAYAPYEIVDSGKWTVNHSADSVDSVQIVNDPASGYGYEYRKTIQLAARKPEMVIEHSLKNIGKLRIETRQYNHNFLVLDKSGPGPECVITLPFEIKTSAAPDPKLAEIRGGQILYKKLLQDKDMVQITGIQGFGGDPKDFDIKVENRARGAGYRMTSDRPLAAVSLWSIRSNISMEPDVDVSTDPGATSTWKYFYTYYTITR